MIVCGNGKAEFEKHYSGEGLQIYREGVIPLGDKSMKKWKK